MILQNVKNILTSYPLKVEGNVTCVMFRRNVHDISSYNCRVSANISEYSKLVQYITRMPDRHNSTVSRMRNFPNLFSEINIPISMIWMIASCGVFRTMRGISKLFHHYFIFLNFESSFRNTLPVEP